MLFFREKVTNILKAMTTVHVDDLGLCGENGCVYEIMTRISQKFGGKKGLRVQRGVYTHVGMLYEVMPNGDVLTGQLEYVQAL